MTTLETECTGRHVEEKIGEIGNLYKRLMIGKDLGGHGIDPFPTTCQP